MLTRTSPVAPLHALRRRQNLALSELARRTGVPLRRLAEIEYHDLPLAEGEHAALVAALDLPGWTLTGGIAPAPVRRGPVRLRRHSRRARWVVAAVAAALLFGYPLPASARGGDLVACAARRAAPAPVGAGALQRWTVAAAALNLRAEPRVGACVVDVLAGGSEVILLDEQRTVGRSTWVRVWADYRRGWVNVRHLAPKRAVVDSLGLNLRAGPGIGYRVVRVLRRGSQVLLRASSQAVGRDRWVKVAVGQREGWVNQGYLAVNQPTVAAMTVERAPAPMVAEAPPAAEASPAAAEAPSATAAPPAAAPPATAAPTSPAIPVAAPPAAPDLYTCPVVSDRAPIIITQGYGVGTHVPSELWGAIDLAPAGGPAMAAGAVVVAAHAGTTSVALNSWPGGNYVRIYGADGWETGYAHLDSVFVVGGEAVAAGQPLGLLGSSGMAFGPHLEFSLWQHGVNVDPTPLIDCR